MRSGIAVLDFGGQYAHLICNRIRRLGVYAEVFPPTTSPSELSGARGVVFSGGPASVYDEDPPDYHPGHLQAELPILGLCYGHQLICRHLGGEVTPGSVREYGSAQLQIRGGSSLFEGLGASEVVWMSHGDTVGRLPEGFRIVGETDDCPAAAVEDPDRRIYGLQFHPEVAHTPRGMDILDNFLQICGAPRTWTMAGYAKTAISEIREHAGDRNVFLLVSGGVDSSVAFVLFNRALGASRVRGLHIDTGFMREGETAQVEEFLTREGFENLEIVDASEDFLGAVEGLIEPEEKRQAIGRAFLEVKDRVIDGLGLDAEHWLLGQGTLYPDTIESGGTEHSALIKTHHNRIDLVEALIAKGLVIEPLAHLYKDEVRDLGTQLGLPETLVWRHPFPGPGLAVRCLCSAGQAPSEDLQALQDLAVGAAGSCGLEVRVLPIKSVGVQGDFRTYAHPALVSGDADWEILEQVSTRLTNSVRGINRVVYLLAPEPLPPQRIKRAFLTRSRLDLLREADSLAMEALSRAGLMKDVSQMPSVLLPLTSDGHQETLVLRPVYTPDFMTARFAELPREFLDGLAQKIVGLDGIEAVLFDITHKPPGTVEWE